MKNNQQNFSIKEMSEELGVSASGYYAWKRQKVHRRAANKQQLTAKVVSLFHEKKKRYGSPRIFDGLKKQGYRCGLHHIADIMRNMGLIAKGSKKFKVTTDSKHRLPVSPNLLNRNFKVDCPNQVWTSDITYIRTREGWLYLAVVLDLYSRKIVGYSISDSLESDIVIDALKMAIGLRNPPPGLIFHSDRGIQYACSEFRALLKHRGFFQSMSRKGDCWDNAPTESLFRTIKVETVKDQDYFSREEARVDLVDFMLSFYNNHRSHSALNYMTPTDFEKQKLVA